MDLRAGGSGRALPTSIAEVFSPENAEALGAYGSFAAAEQTVDPDGSSFASFAEIAEVAGVELKDLK